MTLKEAKDKIAKKYGFKSWAEWSERRTFPISEQTQSEAAELYARSKWDEAIESDRAKMIASMPVGECKAWDFVLWSKNHFESEKPEFNP